MQWLEGASSAFPPISEILRIEGDHLKQRIAETWKSKSNQGQFPSPDREETNETCPMKKMVSIPSVPDVSRLCPESKRIGVC